MPNGKVVFSIQTNGTLFNKKNLEILKKNEVRIGISIDGSKEKHDKYRVYHNGNGSYDDILKGLNLVRNIAPDLLDSTLQVIDPKVSPASVLKNLEVLGIERTDLLFPDLNHDTIKNANIIPGEIGNWLIHVFKIWINQENAVHIRIFLTIINLLLGGKNGTDQLGAESIGTIMIETDGSYQVYDGLKTSFSGAGVTQMNVQDSTIESTDSLPLTKAFRNKATYASAICLNCELFRVCGGGNPIHRYSENKKFDQPSVYCEDLKLIINHIKSYILSVRPNLELVC